MVREEVLNTELAGFLARGLARALRIPEESVKVVNARTGVKKGSRRAPDIQLVDFFGVRIIVQGKIDNLSEAIEDCKQTITDGLADACFAASYPASLAAARDILAIRRMLETTEIDLALVKPPTQLTLYGWPEDAVRKLGAMTPAQLLPLLGGEEIYDEIVGTDLAEKLAENIGNILDGAGSFPSAVQETIAAKLAAVLSIRFEPTEAEAEDAEDE
jgi:anthranilate phosphoribosyltransferase